MNAYGLPTGVRRHGRITTVPGGPLPGCLAALALLFSAQAGIRWGLGIPGLGGIRTVNDEVIAATAPLLLQAVLLATAVGAYLAVSADDRRDGVVTETSQRAVVATVLVCVVLLPLLAGRPMLGVPRSTGLLLPVLAAEVAVGAGVALGYAAVRRSVLVPPMVAAALALLFALSARTVLAQALLSDAAVTSSQIGLAGAARAAADLRTWTPRAHAVAAMAAVAATIAFLPSMANRPSAWAAAACGPPLLAAVALPSVLFGGGFDRVVPDGAGLVLWTLGGAAAGCVLALPLAHVLNRRWSR
ncbi:hypothetical protein Acsp03_63900 [Actinomadura sp. NBRC 104412]|uniref:hypothetical protein n=1 Tax=Actinomadura sp. NBRC 104412 TaxID=3032203 RepID=UPI0024A3DFB1|nr:hypothetical protein [Actinomadura sp. NBRC 104412]GLZ08924.1 hypothetical protein Acsp03_63900 [Actinomadura sp. NBRC 104412]